jgi:hypothetical protein
MGFEDIRAAAAPVSNQAAGPHSPHTRGASATRPASVIQGRRRSASTRTAARRWTCFPTMTSRNSTGGARARFGGSSPLASVTPSWPHSRGKGSPSARRPRAHGAAGNAARALRAAHLRRDDQPGRSLRIGIREAGSPRFAPARAAHADRHGASGPGPMHTAGPSAMADQARERRSTGRPGRHTSATTITGSGARPRRLTRTVPAIPAVIAREDGEHGEDDRGIDDPRWPAQAVGRAGARHDERGDQQVRGQGAPHGPMRVHRQPGQLRRRWRSRRRPAPFPAVRGGRCDRGRTGAVLHRTRR